MCPTDKTDKFSIWIKSILIIHPTCQWYIAIQEPDVAVSATHRHIGDQPCFHEITQVFCQQPLHASAKAIFVGISILLAVCLVLHSHVYIPVTLKCIRQSRMLVQAMRRSSTYSGRSRNSSAGSTAITTTTTTTTTTIIINIVINSLICGMASQSCNLAGEW
jgi:hypothetical protein